MDAFRETPMERSYALPQQIKHPSDEEGVLLLVGLEFTRAADE